MEMQTLCSEQGSLKIGCSVPCPFSLLPTFQYVSGSTLMGPPQPFRATMPMFNYIIASLLLKIYSEFPLMRFHHMK